MRMGTCIVSFYYNSDLKICMKYLSKTQRLKWLELLQLYTKYHTNLVTKVWMPQMSNYFYSVFANYFENFERHQ